MKGSRISVLGPGLPSTPFGEFSYLAILPFLPARTGLAHHMLAQQTFTSFCFTFCSWRDFYTILICRPGRVGWAILATCESHLDKTDITIHPDVVLQIKSIYLYNMNKKVESQMLNDCPFHKPIIVQRSAVSTFTLVPGPILNPPKLVEIHQIKVKCVSFTLLRWVQGDFYFKESPPNYIRQRGCSPISCVGCLLSSLSLQLSTLNSRAYPQHEINIQTMNATVANSSAQYAGQPSLT